MKKALLVTTAILMATSATQANAETWPRWYIGLGVGITHQNESDVDGVTGVGDFEYETGHSFNAALGYRLQPHESLFGNGNIEIEYTFRSEDIDNQTVSNEVKASTTAVNYIEHLGTGSMWKPYLGAGIGISNIEVEGTTRGDDDVFIYQLLGGFGYEPETMPNTRLKIGYRYLGTFSDPDYSTGDFEYDNHSIEAGAEFRF